MYFDNTYDERLLQAASIYRIHPELLPFIGNKYAAAPIKILFVGESHYVEDCTVQDFVDSKWYEQNVPNNNIYKDKGEFYTRGVVEGCIKNNSGIWFNIFRFPSKIIIQKQIFNNCSTTGDVLENVAFMNYFQRPSLNKAASITTDEIYRSKSEEGGKRDDRIAAQTLNNVVSVINPSKVIFLSKTTADKHKTNNSADIFDFVAHPCRPWWYRDNGRMGWSKLESILDSLVNMQNNK